MKNEKPADIRGESFEHLIFTSVYGMQKMLFHSEPGKQLLFAVIREKSVTEDGHPVDLVQMIDDYIAGNVFRLILNNTELAASLAYHVKERYITNIHMLLDTKNQKW